MVVSVIGAPDRFSWLHDAQSTDLPDRDTEVWFVGKLGEWYVPARPGVVNEMELAGSIRVDGLPVSPGTSGAPLISEHGIVGMVVSDASVFADAPPLDAIRRAVEKWGYPWQLAIISPQTLRPSAPSATPLPQAEPIVVWKVGSPHTGATPSASIPLDLEINAERNEQRELKVEAYAAKGFADVLFNAFRTKQEPDILAIDNYGIVDGINTQLGTFTGIGSSETVRQSLLQVTESLRELEGPERGWEYLFRTSRNFEAAKLLALRSPSCDSKWRSQPLPPDLQQTALRAASAYLEGKPDLVRGFDDPERLHTSSPVPKGRQISETKQCGYWGNEHIAFVPSVTSYESPDRVGRVTLLMIFRKQEKQWKLLAASTDPVSLTTFADQAPKIAGLLQQPWDPKNSPVAGHLIAPDDGEYPKAAAGERFGNFAWKPSSASNVVAEVAEFAYEDDARLFARVRSARGPAVDQISAGNLWTTHSIWRWRVWAISDSGAVSVSEIRSFPN
jgi:hypothetical protein